MAFNEFFSKNLRDQQGRTKTKKTAKFLPLDKHAILWRQNTAPAYATNFSIIKASIDFSPRIFQRNLVYFLSIEEGKRSERIFSRVRKNISSFQYHTSISVPEINDSLNDKSEEVCTYEFQLMFHFLHTDTHYRSLFTMIGVNIFNCLHLLHIKM